MGKVIMSGIVPNLSEPCPYDPVFANNNWTEIIEACQTNKVPDAWAVGDQKNMTINGVDYAIDIIGKNHNAYANGSGTAPLTFQFHDLYQTAYPMRSVVPIGSGWSASDMRNTHLPAILTLMPSEVQAGIKKVSIPTIKASENASDRVIVNGTEKLFLLSEFEVFGVVKYAYAAEGTQYAYYAAGNTSKKKKPGASAPAQWWLRSASNLNVAYFCQVRDDEGVDANMATAYAYPAPAFCF